MANVVLEDDKGYTSLSMLLHTIKILSLILLILSIKWLLNFAARDNEPSWRGSAVCFGQPAIYNAIF